VDGATYVRVWPASSSASARASAASMTAYSATFRQYAASAVAATASFSARSAALPAIWASRSACRCTCAACIASIWRAIVPPLQSGGAGITNGSLELVDGGLERSLDLAPPPLEHGPIGSQRRGGRVLERLDLSRKVFERLRQELQSLASPWCHQP
jgi:hypothetical protein